MWVWSKVANAIVADGAGAPLLDARQGVGHPAEEVLGDLVAEHHLEPVGPPEPVVGLAGTLVMVPSAFTTVVPGETMFS